MWLGLVPCATPTPTPPPAPVPRLQGYRVCMYVCTVVTMC